MKENNVLLVSGGMDSFIAYYYLREKYKTPITTLFINYNGVYTDKEEMVVQNLFPATIIIKDIFNFHMIETGDKCYIPNRNIYLLSYAAKFGNNIFFGGLKDDNVGDKSREFSKSISKTLSMSLGKDIKVDSPFWDFNKSEIIEWFINHVEDKERAKELLLKTTSCYDEVMTFCGKCPSCFRKACALIMNDIILPFHNKKLAFKYFQNMEKYSFKRQESIIKLCNHFNWFV